MWSFRSVHLAVRGLYVSRIPLRRYGLDSNGRLLGGIHPVVTKLWQGHNQQHRWFGQPAAQTHPHLVQEGHVTPGISAEEYRTRRQKLIELMARTNRVNHSGGILVIIPSAPKLYMTHDIPYPFRQNTNFLYLCGFLEPDSVLVLESRNGTSHTATLFVPKRDPFRERWDGPRSGVDGAVFLTGVDAAYNNDELGKHLPRLLGDHHLNSVWYDGRKPAHPEFHNRYFNQMLLDFVGKSVQSPQTLVQSLRLIKSPAEIELMKQTLFHCI